MATFYRLLTPLFFLILGSCFLVACTTDLPPASMVQVLDCAPRENPNDYLQVSLQNYTYTQGKMMFTPQNIRLGGQTPLLPTRKTSRTNKGLQLHVSVNNQQHQLSNENIFDYPLEDGKYDLFAFITDSYEEAIKTPNAILGRHIEISKGTLAGSRPIEQVALVYNLPIGTHEINETDSILLDFVLYSTQLEEKGNYVSFVINQQAPIRLDKWQPYYLTGLSEGEHNITMTLNNAAGKPIATPVNNSFIVKKPS
ncbi:MAG: hypothetical protein ACRBFS_26345 [Aureispira sp.]